MTTFIDEMQRRTFAALSDLHAGVDELVLTDFPDYENIGDSMIALGQAAFWRRAGIRLRATYSWMTIDDRVYASTVPVAIQGGGNFGGLYPRHSAHRYRLAERLRAGTLLIQEPQSVHFTTDAERSEFRDRMATRPGLRLAVRDRTSLETVCAHVPDAALSPDSVHMLGAVDAPAPVQEILYVLRRDDESTLRARAAGAGAIDGSVDWPAMTNADRARRRLERIVREGALTRRTNRTTERWFADADARLRTGVALLGRGETIVTDRLHAMLLALQLGRRVIAIDNSTGKLSSYVDTWFGDLDMPLQLVSDLAEAREAVH
ncbi:polysaccharide pyruvyl transferase family protein [Microbacterium rhizophilus]|uniref:polysaccharide pyruvyl transferase family protein n=1 Tax=Microbacterium rhizophilus TaxID=3138934 RepID=UPI0031E92ED5